MSGQDKQRVELARVQSCGGLVSKETSDVRGGGALWALPPLPPHSPSVSPIGMGGVGWTSGLVSSGTGVKTGSEREVGREQQRVSSGGDWSVSIATPSFFQCVYTCGVGGGGEEAIFDVFL